MADLRTEGKEWYNSKTIQSAVASFGTALVPMVVMAMLAFGYEVNETLQAAMVAFIVQLISMVFTGGSIWARLKAKEEIKPTARTVRRKPPVIPNGYSTQGMMYTLATVGVIVTLMLAHNQAYATEADTEQTVVMDSATITITAPTSRVDGTALPASEIQYYLVVWKGPNNTTGELVQPGVTGVWTPPAVGEYEVYARTVDTNGLTSEPSMTINYTAKELTSEPSPPRAPITEISFPVDGTVPGLGANYTIDQKASGFFDRTPSTDGKNWTMIEQDGRTPLQAPVAETSNSAWGTNARVDYLVSTNGGPHTISFTVYAKDGKADSLYLGLNGAPYLKFNEGQPVFFNTNFGKWTTSTPLPITLPAGQSVITLFMREPGLLVDSFEIRTVVK